MHHSSVRRILAERTRSPRACGGGRPSRSNAAAGPPSRVPRAGAPELLALALAVLSGPAGCAPVLPEVAEPTPAEIPALEAHLAARPDQVPVLVRLGVAHRAAGDLETARARLERAAELSTNDPAAVFYLGLTYEELGRPGDARRLYESYLAVGRTPELRGWIRGRIPVLRRQELAEAAREAVLQEIDLAATEPRPRHVAVFPFLYAGADPRYRPLGRALAELLVTDLSQTDRLTVLERMQVQLLVDEMRLVDTGFVDPSTGARGGRLMGAEHVVQGRVDATEAEIELEGAVVRVTEAARMGAPVRERDAARRLFDVQKRLALELYRVLGIELTPAERERVLRRPTNDLDALIAYGLGLEAMDGGDFAQAAVHFRTAVELDPGFAEARTRAENADETVASAEITLERLAQAGLEELRRGVMDAPTLEALEALEALIPEPLVRDAVAETRGQEGIGRRAVLDIILRRP